MSDRKGYGKGWVLTYIQLRGDVDEFKIGRKFPVKFNVTEYHLRDHEPVPIQEIPVTWIGC